MFREISLPKPLRSRWPHILLAILILIVLSPSGVFLPLAENLRAANRALSTEKWSVALDRLETAIHLEPALWSTHLKAASLALQDEDAERALQHLSDPIPLDSRFYCLQVQAAIMTNDIQAAEQAWQRADGICEEKQDYYRALTLHYWDQNDRSKAQSVLEEWIEFDETDPQPFLQLGILLAVTQPEEAISPLRKAQLLSNEGIPLASALIRAVEDARETDIPAYTLASVGQALMRYAAWTEAVWAFEEALVQDPEYIEAHAYLGLALDQSGGNGYSHLQNAISNEPDNAVAYIFLAYHWQMKGKPKTAKIYLEAAAGLDPTNPVISAELAQVYVDLGDLEAAKEALKITVSLAPRDAHFWYLLAQFSIERGIELESLGLPAARNAWLLDKDNVLGLVLLGDAHRMLGNIELAERLLWRAVQIDPNYALTQYYLGLLRHIQGDRQRAQAAWEYALYLDPAGPVGELARRMIELLQPKR
jgi:tetratricopeptide (TPR) repeat protein